MELGEHQVTTALIIRAAWLAERAGPTTPLELPFNHNRLVKPSESIYSNHNPMPNKDTWGGRLLIALIVLLSGSAITWNTYLTNSVNRLAERVQPLESWREEYTKFSTAAIAQIAKERDQADDAVREKILREVERNASLQRESIQAQLQSIARDVLKIAVIIDAKRDVPTWPKSSASGTDNTP